MKRAVALLAAVMLAALVSSASGTHVRPKAAWKISASLVPSYEACTAPDRMHGPPLAFPSCSSPDQSSSYLTVGTPDANGAQAKSEGTFLWIAEPGLPGPPTDNQIAWDISVTDVRCAAAGPGCAGAGADYAGSVEARWISVFTDHNNNVNPGGGNDPATTQPFEFGFPITCTTTSDPSIGSKCSRHISYIEELFMAIPDGKRTVWEAGQVEIWDGGTDADGSTKADNTKFAVQGVFVP